MDEPLSRDSMDWEPDTSPIVLHCSSEPFNKPSKRKFEFIIGENVPLGRERSPPNFVAPLTSTAMEYNQTIVSTARLRSRTAYQRRLNPLRWISDYVMPILLMAWTGVDRAYAGAKRRFRQNPDISSTPPSVRRSPNSMRSQNLNRSVAIRASMTRSSLCRSTVMQPCMPCTYPESPLQTEAVTRRPQILQESISNATITHQATDRIDTEPASIVHQASYPQDEARSPNPLFKELDEIHAQLQQRCIPDQTLERATIQIQSPMLECRMDLDPIVEDPQTPAKSRKNVTFVASPKTGRPVTRTKRYVIGEAISYPSPSSSRDEDSTFNSISESHGDSPRTPLVPASNNSQKSAVDDNAVVTQIQRELLTTLANNNDQDSRLERSSRNSGGPTAPHSRVASESSNDVKSQSINGAQIERQSLLPDMSEDPTSNLRYTSKAGTEAVTFSPNGSSTEADLFNGLSLSSESLDDSLEISSELGANIKDRTSHVTKATLSNGLSSSSESCTDSPEISRNAEADIEPGLTDIIGKVYDAEALKKEGADDVFVTTLGSDGRQQDNRQTKRTSSLDLSKDVQQLEISSRKVDPLEESGRRSSVRQKRISEAAAKAKEAEEAQQKLELEEKISREGLLRIPKVTVIPPLSAKANHLIDEALGKGMSTNVATTSTGISITRRDIGKVLPQAGTTDDKMAWLNDEIILAYLQMVVDHGHQRNPRRRNQTPAFHAFSPFFYKNLQDKGYDAIKRWAKKARIGGKDLLDAEYVFIPVNQSGNHWTIVIVSPKRRTIQYFDSMHGKASAVYRNIKEWLKGELGSEYSDEEWTIREQKGREGLGGGPTQQNMSDCGVFAITTAKMVSLGVDPMAVSAADMPLQRRRIVAEVLNGDFSEEYEPNVVFDE